MTEARRNPELLLVLGTQFHQFSLTESRRASPEIDGHIVNSSAGTADQFPLGGVPLIVEPSEHTTGRKAFVVLYEVQVETEGLGQTFVPPRFHEIAPLVAKAARLEHLHSAVEEGA